MATRSTTEPTVEDLKLQIEQLRADMTELGALMRGVAEAKASDAKAGAKEAAAKAEAKARGYYEDAALHAMSYEDAAAAYVREKPMQSLAIAAGVGAVVGFLTRPR